MKRLQMRLGAAMTIAAAIPSHSSRRRQQPRAEVSTIPSARPIIQLAMPYFASIAIPATTPAQNTALGSPRNSARVSR